MKMHQKYLLAVGWVFFQAGLLWGMDSQVISGNVKGAAQPQICMDASGNIYAVFGADDSIWFVQSNDQGKTFSNPSKIAHVPGLPLGMGRGPRIAANDGVLVVTAIDENLNAWSSRDEGATWTKSKRINEKPKSASEAMHDLQALPDGEFYIVWLDNRKGGMALYGSRSQKRGSEWGPDVSIYESPDGNICECCAPTVTADEKGVIHALWRNWLGGNRDMYVASSSDGHKFSASKKLGIESWPLNGCPMNGGDLAVAKGQLVAIWGRKGGIFLTTTDREEDRVGDGVHPAVAAGDRGIYLAWEVPGKGVHVRWTGQEPILLDPQGTFPRLASSGDGSKPVIVWSSRGTIRLASLP